MSDPTLARKAEEISVEGRIAYESFCKTLGRPANWRAVPVKEKLAWQIAAADAILSVHPQKGPKP